MPTKAAVDIKWVLFTSARSSKTQRETQKRNSKEKHIFERVSLLDFIHQATLYYLLGAWTPQQKFSETSGRRFFLKRPGTEWFSVQASVHALGSLQEPSLHSES